MTFMKSVININLMIDGATLGIESLKEFNSILKHRKKIYDIYLKGLSYNKNINCIHDYSQNGYAAWIFTIVLKKKDYLQKTS